MSLAPPSIILSPIPQTLPHNPTISLLPFQISYDGPALISTYFPTRPRIPTRRRPSLPSNLVNKVVEYVTGSNGKREREEEGEGMLESAFRGRLLLSTPWVLPDGFTGLVFGTNTPAPSLPIQHAITSLRHGSDERNSKRVKLNNGAGTEEAEKDGKEKGKGKEKVLMSVPDGRRRSPRKKAAATKMNYSMDSDEEDGEEREMLEVDNVPIEVVVTMSMPMVEEDESTVLSLESPAPFSTTTTPLESQEPPSASHSSILPLPLPLEAGTSTTTTTMEEEGLQRDTQSLVPKSTFSTIQIWSADIEVDLQEDLYAKTLVEWFAVAEKVHAY